jgi:hypothetical protein
MKKYFYPLNLGGFSKSVKSIVLTLVFTLTVFLGNSATYYLTSAGANAAQTPSSWNTNAAGSGTAATNFTTDRDVFNVPVGINGVVSGNWVFGTKAGNSGNTTSLTINGTLTINSGVILTLQQNSGNKTALTINSGGSIIFNDISNSQLLGSLNGGGAKSKITYTLNSGASLKTANSNGISGSINTTNLTSALNTAANYEFSGDNQSMIGLPITVNNLTLSGSNTITLDSIVTVSGILTINNGVLFDMSIFLVTLKGNLVNNGTTTGTGGVTLTNSATQSIDSFSNSGTITMSKNGGIATFNGNVTGGGLTINGSGGTLNLGAGFTHSFTVWTRTNGTLNGGSSVLNLSGSVSGTSGTFTSGTSTVNYTGAAQTAAAVTYYNLTISGTNAKTFPSAFTVNGILSMEGLATISRLPTYGVSAVLQYKGSSAQITGLEFPATFTAGRLASIKIENPSGVTLNASKNIGSRLLEIGSVVPNSVFNDGGYTLTTTGTLNLNSGSYIVAASTFPAYATPTIATGTTINYASASTQTVILNSIGNLTISGSGSKSISSTTVNGDLVISGAVNVSTSNNLAVSGNITIDSGSVFNANSYTYSVGGNWSNRGIFNPSTSVINFNGASLQTISGTNTFNKVVFNNSNGFALSNTITINDTCTFTNGILTGNVTFGTNATTNVGTSTSFVDGTITKNGTNAFTFPIGNAGVWAPISISAPTQPVSATYFHSGYPNTTQNYMCTSTELDHVSSVEYWDLTTTGTYPNVTLHWKNAAQSGISDTTDIRVAHWTGSCWESKGAVGVTGDSTGSVTGIGFTSYSPITFGTKTKKNTLPVSLIDFNVSNVNGKVSINWSTATETNNSFFTIERSIDGVTPESIGTVKGAGNSNIITNYNFIDENSTNGLVYYRLKQTDFDGTMVTFNWKAVNVSNLKSNVVKVYPNPTTGKVNLSISNISALVTTVKVFDLLGQEKYNQVFESSDVINTSIDFSSVLPSGVYYVEVVNENQRTIEKLVLKK